MSDFKEIVNYLKFFRDNGLSKTQTAILVSFDYKEKQEIHEEDFIYINKEDIKNASFLVNLGNDISTNAFYLQSQPNNQIFYYRKQIFLENNTTVTKYKRIPDYFNDQWEILDENTLTEINIESTIGYYYDQITDKIIWTNVLDEVVIKNDFFTYSFNDISLGNGKYDFNYKDEEGYTSDNSDRFLRALLSNIFNLYKSEKNRIVDLEKNNKAGLVNLFPKISMRSKNRYYLQYNYYEKGIPHNSFISEPAITLEFNYFGALLEFLNQTLFYELDDLEFYKSNTRQLFLEQYTLFVNSLLNYARGKEILEVLYYLPVFFFKKIDINFLWNVLDKTIEDSVTNAGLNTEDIVIHLLEGIYESSKNDNIFLQELINRRTNKKKSLLHELILRVDGENFKKMVYFLWNIWKNSDFSKIDPEKNKFIDITDKNPVLVDYRSNKRLGFHTDNTNIEWKLNTNTIDLKVISGTGIYEEMTMRTADGNETRLVEQKITHHYDYHPLSPLAIIDLDNPTFIFKDNKEDQEPYTILPAFVLIANNESAFWENVITATEYTFDVLTTLSGVGNILKVGRLAKILKAGHSLIGKTKTATNIIKGAKTVAGVVEVTAGVGNALLKLLDINDTELGREIAKYFFYLEMLSLSGELSVVLYSKLQNTASKIVAKKELLRKTAKNADEAKQIDEVIEHLENVTEVQRKLGDFIMHSGDDISESFIKNIVKQVRESTGLKNFDIHLVDRNNEKYRKLFEQWQKGGGYGFFKPTSGEFGIPLYKGLFGEGPQIYMFAGKTLDEWGVAQNVFFTKYTTQHELFHVEMFIYLKNKTPNYMKYWAEIPNYIHEQYVLNRLLKTKNWKKEDLLSDLNNINGERIKNLGMNRITLKELETWKFEIELEKIGIKLK